MIRRTFLSLAAATVMVSAPVAAADLIDMATANGSLNMLVESVGKAGIGDTLRGQGPFTVFAPNDNDAFAKIEEGGEVEQLWADPPALKAVLNYHVVLGRVMAADLTEGMKLSTVDGHELTVSLDGGPKVDGANILATDIEADNGVIHIIDTVLTPPK